MERKTLAIGIVVIIAIAAGTTGAVLYFMQPAEEKENTLIFGTMYIVVDLDPQGSWDSASMNVIDQVCEPLLTYDFDDPQLAIIPQLATARGEWNEDGDEYKISLREGVTFHDGAPFNATAVKFTWDRMAWALNTTGTNMIDVTIIEELYVFPDGIPIVNDTIINTDYSVTFKLNRPYIAFEALLCFEGSYILSPKSTPADRYLDTATDILVGTGPFVYDSTEPAVEVKMHAYENYWGGKSKIEYLIFSEIVDSNARNIALLSGDVDYINPMWEYYPVFEFEDGITLDESELGTTIQYLGMNNKKINLTLRRAISKAIDYDYLIDSLTLGHSVRLKSPIPMAIWAGNWSNNPETYDVTAARQLMQFMGYETEGWNATYDPDHLKSNTDHVKWRTANFLTYNYTYNIGNPFREDMLIYLADALKDIGIKVLNDGMTWGEFLYRLYEIEPLNRDMLGLYFVGWIPDYNDPSNFINPLFTNRVVGANGAQYNGTQSAIEDNRDPNNLWDNVQLLMEAAIEETDTKLREQYYDKIQYLLVERDIPWAYVYSPLPSRAYDAKLHGIPPYMMLMDREIFYPMYFA